MVSAVFDCRLVSSRLIPIRLTATPFNVIIIQVYAPASGGHDKVDNFYRQLQEIIDQTPRKDILAVQVDWMVRLEGMHKQTGETYVDPTAMLRQIRGLGLLEFATCNNLVFTNTPGLHMPSI